MNKCLGSSLSVLCRRLQSLSVALPKYTAACTNFRPAGLPPACRALHALHSPVQARLPGGTVQEKLLRSAAKSGTLVRGLASQIDVDYDVEEVMLGKKEGKKPKRAHEELDSALEKQAEPKKKKSKTAALDEAAGKDRAEAEIEGAFDKFKISDATVKKLKDMGVTFLFPVQYHTYDHIWDGKDVIVQARTGTGKTLSFAIPLVEKLHLKQSRQLGRMPKVLAMAPTRELAVQVHDEFKRLSDQLNVACIYGGASYEKQETAIVRGIDVLVGTPGRILDFVEKGSLDFSKVEHIVLDEVDRMLDMGFADNVESIIKTAYENKDRESKPQTLLWSATTPAWVHKTASKYMDKEYKHIDLIGRDRVKTATTVQHLAIKCGYQDRPATIGDVLKVYSGNHGRAMVFCQTKRDADELTVSDHIKQETHVLHGDIPQDKREMVLKGFREGRYKVLITTDVAARGLDIPEVDLVIQCSPPKDVDSYIHRAGRTGRAGRVGTCVCFYKPQELNGLNAVERYAGITFKKVGAPTMEDIIESAASDAARSLDDVNTETLAHFKKSALELIEKKGAEDALAAALAVISGSTDIKSRSLLGSQEGFTTYLFQTNMEINSKSYVWRALERRLPPEVSDKIKNMALTKDHMGCVFDLPSELDSSVEDRWTDGKFDTLQKATELPELDETDARGGFRGRGGYNNRGGFNSRGGGYNSRGGYNDRGGYNNRGGFNNRGGGYGNRGGNFGGGSSRGGYGGGYQGGNSGGYQGGSSGGYQGNRGGYQGGSSGGYGDNSGSYRGGSSGGYGGGSGYGGGGGSFGSPQRNYSSSSNSSWGGGNRGGSGNRGGFSNGFNRGAPGQSRKRTFSD